MSDEQHFERVVRTHGPALGRLAAAYERDAQEREDLLQDILFALWRALPTFRGECSERTFVYRVAHNRALTYRRQARPRNEALDEAVGVSDPHADPAEDAALAQRREHLLDAIRRLPTGYRQVVTLRLEDLSNPEIADVLGVNENTVAIRLTRARKALAELMHEEWSNV
jgi:RNA polymerase sigma factor (sigma-70 family)